MSSQNKATKGVGVNLKLHSYPHPAPCAGKTERGMMNEERGRISENNVSRAKGYHSVLF